ncbi:DNA repair protein rad51c [Coemansia brasiliensis]|uniref:DNA repair protein RAD51 homolog 3 n=1 Tax=Coemansia brasiliensis TaxID=2650707 RepID=A0A9W8I8S6_9FUNG|nr:DNA repair protein rad51c [Coemansia brasiliensis]
MPRPVLSLCAPTSILSQLIQDGYHTVSDIDASQRPPALPAVKPPQPAQSAWSLACQLHAQPYFSTYIPELDTLLGGRGLPLGEVCELVAYPASEIASLCLRLCLAIQMPPGNKCAVYVDTTGSFSQSVARKAANAFSSQQSAVSSDSLLENIRVLRIHSADELHALLVAIDEQIIPNVGLLLINSITWPFIASLDIFRRQSMHAEVAKLLAQIARKHKIGVVVVSHAKSDSSLLAKPEPMDGSVWTEISANSLAIHHSPLTKNMCISLTHSSTYPAGMQGLPLDTLNFC